MLAALVVTIIFVPDLSSAGPSWIYFLYSVTSRHNHAAILVLRFVYGSTRRWTMLMASRHVGPAHHRRLGSSLITAAMLSTVL